MDMKQLQEFVDLAQTCNFQETAENLNISQSCLSKHIQKLEEGLGVQLFDRVHRKVELNQYGTSFLAYARKILALNTAAIHEINEIRSSENNSLRVGFHPILGQYGIVELVSGFCKEYPEIAMEVIESSRPEEMLKSMQCDVVFAPEDELADPNIRRIPYMRDNLVVICADNHPLAKESRVTLERLRAENFIAHSDSLDETRTVSMNLFKLCSKKGGFVPNVVATVSRTATVAKFVSQGRGIALLFRKHLPIDITGISTVDIFPEVSVNICLFFLKHPNLPAAMNTFLKYTKSVSKAE